MIKGLAITPPVIGRISIGHLVQKGEKWLITSCRSANNIMPITIFLPAFIASFFYSA